MRRLLLRLIGVTAAFVAAVLVWVVVTLPPAARRLADVPSSPLLVTGAYHIHSSRSDGSGTLDEIAAAAAAAGLQFVIVTDHSDGTAPPETAYRHGVLCIDAAEVSTVGGHVVALGLRAASAFPLGGETADVVEDIHRLGGVAIAAHPNSPRPALSWRAGGNVPLDGVEWFNADSEWRAHSPGTLVAAAMRAWFRPAESVAALFRAPAPLRRWQTPQRSGPPFTLAAVDAHARVGGDVDEESSSTPWSLSLPSYETMFRTVVQTVLMPAPLTGDPARDAAAVIAAIAGGHSYSVVRAFVDAPQALEFWATDGSTRVEAGGSVTDASLVALHAAVPADAAARLVLLNNGREVASGRNVVDFQAAAPGWYRVEAYIDEQPMPWIVSNAIRVGGEGPLGPPVPPAQDSRAIVQVTPIAASTWVIETDRTSVATIGREDESIRLRYQLGPGVPAGQYAALASGASGEAAIERIEFTASSPRPLRLSVQVRLPGAAAQRWRRSIYVDDVPRRFSIRLADLDPVDRRSPLRPISARVQSILLVMDTVNARPGSSGEVLLRDLGYVVARGDAR